MILQGNCLDVMKDMDSDSVDLIVTDPPYGYSFMGKDWDKALPSVDIWKEALRVLKPGAFAFVMCAPRQDVLARQMMALEDAGFVTNFTSLYWTYATGFPKAHNISKSIDKKAGAERKVIGKGNIPPRQVERGTYKVEWKESGDRPVDNNVYGHDKRTLNERMVQTAPATEDAKKFDGAYGGFQPKPAVEVIIVVMKPLTEKTYVGQALENGKGLVWFDDCRIPYSKDGEHVLKYDKYSKGEYKSNPDDAIFFGNQVNIDKEGRFPANLLVSDNVLDDGNNRKGGKPYYRTDCKGRGILGEYDGRKTKPTQQEGFGMMCNYGDEGTYSKFFSLDKWVERNLPFLITPKASKKEKNKGCDKFKAKPVNKTNGKGRTYNDRCANCGKKFIGPPERICKCKDRKNVSDKTVFTMKNSHPTVKPVQLMSWLITLGSREGDLILDPFAGSGTTGVAAKTLKRNFIMIEMEAEYCEIMAARLEAVEQNKVEAFFE